MTGTAQKYGFDTVFSADGEVLRDGKGVKRILTHEEAEAMKREGFEEGQASETARAAQAQAEALRAIAGQMQLILARLHGESETLKADAAALAVAAASKIAGEAITNFGEDTIAALAGEVMKDLRAEPRLSILCAPELASGLSVKLEETATKLGFEGAAIVRGEDGMTGADCRLEWTQGAIGRSQSDIEARIEDLVARWLRVGAEDETETAPETEIDEETGVLPGENANVA